MIESEPAGFIDKVVVPGDFGERALPEISQRSEVMW
jgi:hypothetical protein